MNDENLIMYTTKRVGIFDIPSMNKVANILNTCGKDMGMRYNLHHWDNPYLKTLAIVGVCILKNDIYLIYNDGERPVATFMTRKCGEDLYFEKLGTLPAESGKGVGSFCINKIEEIAKEAGCKKVVMEVYESSIHAVTFYEHRGYKVVGKTETLKYKEVKMEKSIC